MKCFIDIVAKFFTNKWINIVKKKYNFFRFFQVYEFVNWSTIDRQTWQPLRFDSYKAFEKAVKFAITKVKGLYKILCVAAIRLPRFLLIKKTLDLKARPRLGYIWIWSMLKRNCAGREQSLLCLPNFSNVKVRML